MIAAHRLIERGAKTVLATLGAAGAVLVNETGSLLEKIVDRIGEINDLITNIAESSTKQSANLQQVNSAVGEMDRMTQQNAAMVEQSTAAARSLADEANELTSLVSTFSTGDGHVGHKPIAHARAENDEPGAAIEFPATAVRRKAAAPVPAPETDGNLALKPSTPVEDDDWSEF